MPPRRRQKEEVEGTYRRDMDKLPTNGSDSVLQSEFTSAFVGKERGEAGERERERER